MAEASTDAASSAVPRIGVLAVQVLSYYRVQFLSHLPVATPPPPPLAPRPIQCGSALHSRVVRDCCVIAVLVLSA